MLKKIFAVALGGVIFSAVVGLGKPTIAKADPFQDAASVCRGAVVGDEWRVGGDCRGMLDAWQDTFSIILSAGASHVEECLKEGCSTEEVREMHRMYKEEMINESGGSYHEMMEIAVGAWQNHLGSKDEALAILGMLQDFTSRGWQVRMTDVNAARNNTF
jgi:hypothetical protein